MNKIINFFKTSFYGQAGLIISATVVAYGLLINNLNLWLDEIYSVLMAKDNLKDIFATLLVEDTNLPLYYIYLKCVLALFPKAYEIAASHFGSFILLIAAQIFAATEVRRDYGNKTALWLMALLALLPQSLWLAFEVRTYMLSSLLMMISAVYGMRLLGTPRRVDFIKFGIVSILALYSHYYCALWLMFLYGFLLFFILFQKQWGKIGIPFSITTLCVAICFAPWLYVPLQTAVKVSKVWYVNLEFVRFSWQFFTNPLQPEIVQSIFFIATTFSASVFSFVLLLGLFNTRSWSPKSKLLFIGVMISFILTYILLLCLSYAVRPIVTARYLKIFSVSLYLAAAIVLAHHQNICKAILAVFFIGFVFTYADIRAISFDKGYQTAVSDIKQYISPKNPLLVTDNSNLFCEYFLPEYNCLLLASKDGEILRKKSQIKAYQNMRLLPQETIFSLSIYGSPEDTDNCSEYTSYYRFGQNLKICRFDNPETVNKLLQQSKQIIMNANNMQY